MRVVIAREVDKCSITVAARRKASRVVHTAAETLPLLLKQVCSCIPRSFFFPLRRSWKKTRAYVFFSTRTSIRGTTMSSRSRIHKVNTGIVTSCVVGLALSYYAWVVEVAKEKDESYEAMCDISEHVSCTKAFMSKYGKGFGIFLPDSIFHVPNSIYGLIFYSLLAITCVFNRYYHAVFLVCLAVLSNISSAYLAWILYLLNDICVVCVSTYVVNVVILVLAIRKLRILSRPAVTLSKKKRH